MFWRPVGIQTMQVGRLTRTLYNPGVPYVKAPKPWTAGGLPRGKKEEVQQFAIVMARLEKEAQRVIAEAKLRMAEAQRVKTLNIQDAIADVVESERSEAKPSGAE